MELDSASSENSEDGRKKAEQQCNSGAALELQSSFLQFLLLIENISDVSIRPSASASVPKGSNYTSNTW